MSEYIIDLSSFNVEAENEDDAYVKAVKLINDGLSVVEICGVEKA